MNRAVVTGGAGFIGSHLVDALVERGVEVLVVDNFASGSLNNLEHAKRSASRGLKILELDIGDTGITKAFADFKPHTVFHFAAQMNVRHSVKDPVFDAQENVLGTIRVLEAAHAAGAKKFILASTGGAIYGEQQQFPAPEDHPVLPESPYGVSKRAGELYLEYYAHALGLDAVSLRFANVYGPRQNPKGEAGVVAIFTRQLLSSQPLTVNGDGKQTRDFVFVGDVVAACILAAELNSAGTYSVFNVGRGVESSVLELVELLKGMASEMGVSEEPAVVHGAALAGEQRRSVIDATKLSMELGWKAKVGLKEGLRATVQSFRAEKA